MNPPPTRTTILASQVNWARRRGLRVDERGYLADYAANLRAPLSAAALTAFDRGSGSELRAKPPRPAKMSALHSSSALAVNVFDYWDGRDLARLGRALEVEGTPTRLEFEAQLRTGARGIPPNLDLLVLAAA